MYRLLSACFMLLLGLILFIQPCFAVQKDETIISYINLNNTGFYDIEILLTKNEKILLPFKQMSEIFEVEVKTNHATKEIEFKTKDGKMGKVGLNFIKLDGKNISSKKNIYIKSGLMDDIKDEIYCDEKDLSIIFDSSITTDKNDLSIIANTKRDLILLRTENYDETEDNKKLKTYKNVISPDKEKKLFFESVTLNNNTMSDSVSQYFLQGSTKNLFFNNNTQVVLKGRAYGGDMKVDLNTYNYKGELFSFGGLGFNYHNNYKGLDYEIGRVRGIKEENYTIGNQMLGIQLSNYDTIQKSYRDINGYVAKDSLVKVYVNNKEYTILSTYDGYYSLHNLYLDTQPQNIRLEELKADGSTTTIYEKQYPKYKNMPAKKEKKYTLFSGATGYNNKLFNSNGYIYEMNTKKFVLGSQFEYGIKDNLKFDSKFVMDYIYSQPQNSIWQSIYSTDALLTSGTWKNPNNMQGITSLNTLEHIKNDNIKSKVIFGVSQAKDISLGNKYLPGYTLTAETGYFKNGCSIRGGIFNTSPDFYLAAGDGSYYNDRTGLSLGAGYTKNNSSIEASYKKYISNTANRFDGGLLFFDEYNFGLRKNFEKIADIRFNINGREGSNSIAHNQSYYYDFNISKQVNENISIQAGKTASNYETQYDEPISGNSGYSSKYSTIYLKGDYRLPKNIGTLSLGHDVINYNYSAQENKYNMFKIGYTFPEFKRITLSLGTGYKYTGSDRGFDFSANIAYRTKSGRTINLNYQFNQMGGYIINNMYLPMSSRHSINIVLNDAFAVLPSGLKSVGYNDDNRGFVIVTTYLDKNKNGKYDKGDIPVKDVPIKFSWVNEDIYTNKRGRAFPTGTEAGFYKVKVDTDKLPATLITDKFANDEKLIRIDARKNTKIEFPLKSCVGNITGKLKIIDDFGRTPNITDFIVVLNNETGKEIAYSTVDEKGQFYFSGIEPGKYTIKLDDYFIAANALEDFENKSSINIDIPYVYKDFVDKNNIEIVYKIN